MFCVTGLAQSGTGDLTAPTSGDVATTESVASPIVPSAAAPVTPSRNATVSTALSLGIVVDESHAMRADPALVRSAVNRLLKPMGDDDEAFLVAAKDKPQVVQDFTSDPEEISRHLDHLKHKGKTPLFDAVMTALNHLEEASNERTALIVLAGGEDNASSTSLDAIRQKLASTRTPIYCIAAKDTSWKSQGVLQTLAATNGGSALFPHRDKDFGDASSELSRRLFGDNALAAKEKPLAAYELAIVKSIPVASGPATASFPEGDNVILQKMLVKNLRAKRLFPQVVDGTTPDGVDQSNGAAQGSGAPVEVMGTIIEYKPATKRQARFIRLGGRTALIKVQFLFRDARTGKIVMNSIQEGKVDTGFLGGSPEKIETEAVVRAVHKTVEAIERNR